MAKKTFLFVGILLTAVTMAAGLAHLFALPNKIDLPRDAYFTVQQIYRGWALLGFAVFGALVANAVLAVLARHDPRILPLALIAAVCVALSLAVFFIYTFPANQATHNWTYVPENWRMLRTQWEYSHAAGAALYVIAFIALALAALRQR